MARKRGTDDGLENIDSGLGLSKNCLGVRDDPEYQIAEVFGVATGTNNEEHICQKSIQEIPENEATNVVWSDIE